MNHVGGGSTRQQDRKRVNVEVMKLRNKLLSGHNEDCKHYNRKVVTDLKPNENVLESSIPLYDMLFLWVDRDKTGGAETCIQTKN